MHNIMDILGVTVLFLFVVFLLTRHFKKLPR